MLEIHAVRSNEVSILLSLIRALATYENKPHKVVATEADLRRDLFGPQPKFRALIAEWDGKPVGYASFFYFYSTYEGRAALFLEDLFVLEEFRKHGIGKALLAAVAKLALDEGCFGLRWEVLDWNRPAIEFYEKLGATFLHERKAVAFDGKALEKVASAFSPQGHREKPLITSCFAEGCVLRAGKHKVSRLRSASKKLTRCFARDDRVWEMPSKS